VSSVEVPVPSSLRDLKQILKRTYAGAQRLLAQTLFAYSPHELRSALAGVGIRAGDTVMMHSGFRRASGFSGTPADVIDSVLQAIGPDGNLLMMSIPYRGSSQRYADSNPLFDVQRSPSAVGLISEVFRRRADVVRSLSPLHPVLACGPLAAWLTADHDKATYSCGRGTPFERFLNLDGVFLFYDAPYSSLTFMHYVEDLYRERLPVDPYDPAPATIRIKDASGRERDVRHYFFSAAARERRQFTRVEQALIERGQLQTARVGNTRVLSARARDVVECSRQLIEHGPGVYRS
jgi:aminoglycoside 3-N-acetyltransferase